MKEIGGYLEFERFYGSEYYEDLLRFDSVRTCLLFIIKQRNFKKIYIPYYLCGCIKEVLHHHNIDYEFYNINEDFIPIFDKKPGINECLFFVNYFGQFSNSELIQYKQIYSNIFVDNTQSFFQKPVKGIDTAYSCRKYFGVSDGAYLSTDLPVINIYQELPFDDSSKKMFYTMGRFETSGDQYYDTFLENEAIKRGQSLKKMSLLIQNILKGINYQRVIDIRTRNINYITNNLNIENKIQIKNTGGLFFYPLLIKDGNNIKNRLIKKKIYVPTLWPNVLSDASKDSIEYYYANNLIPLPIDQRYDTDDMKYMLNILHSLLSEG
jgi:hypothetical protein